MRAIRLLAIAIAATAFSGCSMLRPDGVGAELAHNSGLLVDGRNSAGELREDSLDVLNVYVDWQRPLSNRATWYTVAGAGYKVREGGFYVEDSRLVGSVRTGVRFSLDRR